MTPVRRRLCLGMHQPVIRIILMIMVMMMMIDDDNGYDDNDDDGLPFVL